MQRGEEDPYLNHKVLLWSNTWDWSGNHNADEVDGRDATKVAEIERPDDHLVELHGFKMHIGDPVEGDVSDGKWDVYVNNDADHPPENTGWPIHGTEDDTLIASFSGQKVSDDVNGGHGQWHDTAPFWYPKPILSTGKIGILARTSPNDAVGELAMSCYYTYREFDNDEIVQQLLNRE